MIFKKLFIYLFINLFFSKTSKSIMLCEVQGICLKCPDGHISHFICRNNEDCFRGEFCFSKRGFCCPKSSSTIIKDFSKNKCPDGSLFGRRLCKTDVDCLFNDEICIEGKCCPSCKQRRLLVLRELRNIEINFGKNNNNEIIKEEEDEEFIPQCNDNGKYFRSMQCIAHSGECFCVDKFGRRQKNNLKESKNCLNFQEEINKQKEENEKKKVTPKVALNHDRELKIIENNCTDPLREFRNCGSICPISCFSTNNVMPQCSQEQCISGCFCRLPYVLLNISNPFNSPCVLPSECPLIEFTEDLDKWNNGGFFPFNNATININIQKEQNNNQQKQFKKIIEKKCKDPLKNFQNCGSACPVGCGKLLASSNNLNSDESSCSANCVPGCFCRIPYVLRNPNNLDSECIFPQLCPLQTFSLFSSSLISPSSTEEILTQKNTKLLIKGNEEKEKCENNPRKEFLKCGSSCPLGCNQLEKPFRFCSPCISGCFCKNGFIFKNSSEWQISECLKPLECPKKENENNSINLPIKLKAFQKNNEKDISCGEALAIANLYTKEGKKIGKIIVRPEKNEIGINNKKIRLNGEFFSSSISEISNSFLFLSVHQYSDTIINGCKGVGQPIGLNLINSNLNENNNEKEIKIVGELPISRREEENNLNFDQLIEWNETIGYGTNPLIGHSVVLQQHKGLLINVLSCAILGIAPNC